MRASTLLSTEKILPLPYITIDILYSQVVT